MLTQHLREMERDGLIVRTDMSGKVPHVEYSLSNLRGRSVLNLIDFLVQWGTALVANGCETSSGD